VFCQLEATKWYFGFDAALDFSTDPPAKLFNNATQTANHGESSMADPTGKLIFYSNAGTIRNKLHQVMANGTGIKGDRILPVRKPGSSVLYYLFCAEEVIDTFRYSIIDMSLATGNGSVIAKNIPITSFSTEMLAGTLHCNGVDVWVVTHAWGSNNYQSFLLTAGGLQTTPIVSPVGSSVSGPNIGLATSVLKISPTGKKMAAALSDPVADFEVYDFDNATGVASGLSTFTLQYSSVSECEFSPDGSKLYCEFPESVARLYQWDLCTNQKTLLETGFVYAMQLAPNGKVYATKPYDTALDVISFPNRPGTSCHFKRLDQSLFPKRTYRGLPMHISSTYKFGPAITSTVQNDCHSIVFNTAAYDSTSNHCLATTPSIGGITWDFGDNSNKSSAANPIHYYQSPGSYTLKLIIQGPCVADTMRRIVDVPNCTGLFENDNKTQQLKVLPNPNHGEFRLVLNEKAVRDPTVLIRNASGQTIQKRLLKSAEETISLKDISPGIYFLELQENYKVIGRAKVVVSVP